MENVPEDAPESKLMFYKFKILDIQIHVFYKKQLPFLPLSIKIFLIYETWI